MTSQYKILESIQVVTPTKDSFGWNVIGRFKFNPFERLRAGTYAVVYRGKKLDIGLQVAIKVIPKSKLSTHTRKENLEREITFLRELVKDPHIITLHDVYQDSVFYFLVFDLLKEDLYDYSIARELLSEKAAKPIITKIALGIKTLHDKGIVHRDIKQENILLSEGLDVVCICDLGYAIKPKEGFGLYTRCGSPCTIAPEILAECGYGSEVDIWALGCILFALLAGYYPYGGYIQILRGGRNSNPPRLSLECQNLLDGLLDKSPEDRLKVDQVLAHPWLN